MIVSLILVIILGCAILAYLPLTLVVIHKDRKRAKRNRKLDHILDDLGWQLARGELGEEEFHRRVDKTLASSWDRL